MERNVFKYICNNFLIGEIVLFKMFFLIFFILFFTSNLGCINAISDKNFQKYTYGQITPAVHKTAIDYDIKMFEPSGLNAENIKTCGISPSLNDYFNRVLSDSNLFAKIDTGNIENYHLAFELYKYPIVASADSWIFSTLSVGWIPFICNQQISLKVKVGKMAEDRSYKILKTYQFEQNMEVYYSWLALFDIGNTYRRGQREVIKDMLIAFLYHLKIDNVLEDSQIH